MLLAGAKVDGEFDCEFDCDVVAVEGGVVAVVGAAVVGGGVVTVGSVREDCEKEVHL